MATQTDAPVKPAKVDLVAELFATLDGVQWAGDLGDPDFRNSGLQVLNGILGGGWMAGGITEVQGDDDIAMQLAMLSATRIIRDGGCVVAYAPHVLSDSEAAAQYGVPKRLLHVPELYAGQGLTKTFNVVQALASTAPVDMVIIHVPSLVSRPSAAGVKFLDGSDTDRARIVTDAIRKSAPILVSCGTSLVLVNGDVHVSRGSDLETIGGVGGKMRARRARRILSASSTGKSSIRLRLVKGPCGNEEVTIDLLNAAEGTGFAGELISAQAAEKPTAGHPAA